MPVASLYRFLMTSQNFGSISMVRQGRSSWSQVIKVDPLQPKKSATVLPGRLLFLIGMASNSSGFCVG